MKTLLRRSRIYIAESAVVSVVRRELRFDFGVRVKKSEAMRRGAVGEIHVGNILTDFPDDFCVKLVSPNAAPASVMLDRIEIQRKNPHESRPRKRL